MPYLKLNKVSLHYGTLILLDEVEKAHPDIFSILLQVMDYATLTDNNGKKADFRNVILIMTSNAGTSEMNKNSIGFGDRSGDTLSKGKDAVNKLFSAEFRNRLDSSMTFNPLKQETMKMIVEKFLRELGDQLEQKKVNITVSDSAMNWLVKHGYDPQYGARPLSRLIQSEIKDALSDELLFGKLYRGGNVRIDLDGDELSFDYS